MIHLGVAFSLGRQRQIICFKVSPSQVPGEQSVWSTQIFINSQTHTAAQWHQRAVSKISQTWISWLRKPHIQSYPNQQTENAWEKQYWVHSVSSWKARRIESSKGELYELSITGPRPCCSVSSTNKWLCFRHTWSNRVWAPETLASPVGQPSSFFFYFHKIKNILSKCLRAEEQTSLWFMFHNLCCRLHTLLTVLSCLRCCEVFVFLLKAGLVKIDILHGYWYSVPDFLSLRHIDKIIDKTLGKPSLCCVAICLTAPRLPLIRCD